MKDAPRDRFALATAAIFVLIALATFSLRHPSQANAQSEFLSLTGWAWSDTIGWISMNCDNTNSCGSANYGISIGSDGTLSGYAWSDNIGWVSANHADVAYCETNYGGNDPQLQRSGELTGWLRALAGNTDQSGGWDGCISLNGTSYDVIAAADGTFSGFAWGDINVGWVDFSLVEESTTPVCPVGSNYNGTSCIFVACPLDYSQTTDANGNPECMLSSCGLGYTPQNGVCTFTGCPQGYTYQGGQCIYIPAKSPAGAIVATPSLVKTNEITHISWSASDVYACSVSGTNGDGHGWSCTGDACEATTTEPSNPIVGQTVYTLSCTGPNNATLTKSATVSLVPGFCETGAPDCP